MHCSRSLYRNLGCVRRRRGSGSNIFLKFITILIILGLLVWYAEKKISPLIIELSESRARIVIDTLIRDTVNRELSEQAGYEELVNIHADSKGHVTSIQSNIAKLNKLSTELSARIQEDFGTINRQNLSVPVGVLSGIAIFSGLGPEIHIKVTPIGSAEIEFKSEFEEAGINQTRHKIVLQVKTTMGISAVSAEKKSEIVTDIPLVETVIVGHTPDFFVDLNSSLDK